MATTEASRVFAIDLGTSRVKVGVVNDSLETVASSAYGYPSIHDAPRQSEQRTTDWLDALTGATRDVFARLGDTRVDAVVLTAQMPTLVAVANATGVVGNAVTWQDSRADELVDARLDSASRRRITQVAGTPVDGRYIVPMHLRRRAEVGYAPDKVLSAKDFLFFVLTGECVTDPSTASGFGVFDLVARNWSDELCQLWSVPTQLLPDVVAPTYSRPLSARGAAHLVGLAPGTPVFVGGADSVCAHHLVTRRWPNALSIIDGSSTVIVTTCDDENALPETVLKTPLIDSEAIGAEMDLLATGSSIAWFADLFGVSPVQLEEMAIANRTPSKNAPFVYPYLGGGEQGALWRSDLTGVISGVELSTTRADVARALFEGIAFETYRCVTLLRALTPATPLVALSASTSARVVPAILSALLDEGVEVLTGVSPSLVGAAAVAFDGLGVAVTASPVEPARGDGVASLDRSYADNVVERAERYYANTPVARVETPRS